MDNQQISDGNEIANAFINFIVTMGQNINDNVSSQNTNYTRHMRGNFPRNFFLTPVTSDDIISISHSIKPKLSEGYDKISNKLTKLVIN